MKKDTVSQSQCLGMVDISHKVESKRSAMASCVIQFSPQSFKALISGASPKGNVFETARTAGIMAAKSTPNIIPLCHPLPLSQTKIDFKINKNKYSIRIESIVSCLGRTGVEMEALTACAVSALTVYDMMKWSDKGMIIGNLQLEHKTGGKSGDFHRS